MTAPYSQIYKCFLLLSALIMLPTNATAQRERNYIYLLDCTKSMSGYNGTPNIWEPTKKYLKTDIERQTPGTMVHVAPFQGKNLPSYSFYTEKFDWGSMEKTLDGYQQTVTRTNICDAWDLADRFIDQNKDNYIYLLTDGGDNVKGSAELAKRLANFCGKYKNTRAFYVLLTKNAREAIDARIQEIVDNCPEERFVDATEKLNPFGCFDDDLTIYANTLNLKRKHKLSFSAAGEFPAKAICSDPNFNVTIEGGKIKDGEITACISAKKSIQQLNQDLPDEYEFDFDIAANGVDIINPTVKVVMTNKPERELEVISDEQDMGTAEWYDSFLFWGAKDEDTLKVDLKAAFNKEAVNDGSKVMLKVADTEGNKDYRLFFDGREITDGTICLDAAKGNGNVLGLIFNHDAKEGKRYLRITADKPQNLEKINSLIPKDYEVTVRSKYNVVWNPLKTILMWILILIAAGLILWFLILKHLFYPTFKVGSVMVTDPYYSTIRIKGTRKLVFSNKRQEQSVLNRIFTGKIICNVNACWTQPIVVEPNKKTLRVQRNNNYVFDPYGAMLNRHTDYIVENTENNTKIKMTVN